MCDACAMRRPVASNSPTEQSLRSLMLVENDERISVLPMSSVIDSRRLLNTSMAIGSARRVMRAISISRLPEPSTLIAQPGGTSVVALISSMMAGPESRVPMARSARSNTGVAIQPASKCTSRVAFACGAPTAPMKCGAGRSIRPIALSRQFTTSIARPGTS